MHERWMNVLNHCLFLNQIPEAGGSASHNQSPLGLEELDAQISTVDPLRGGAALISCITGHALQSICKTSHYRALLFKLPFCFVFFVMIQYALNIWLFQP